jgi:exopolysaccharide biosynthesis polyprenyl glycosylphosphotransferase
VLREPARLIAYRRLLWDVIITGVSFLLAHQLRSWVLPVVLPGVFPGGLYPLRDYLPLLGAVLLVWPILLAAASPAIPGDVVSLRRELLRTVRVTVLGVLTIAAAGYLLRLHFVSRPFLIIFGGISAGALMLARVVERRTRWGRRLFEAPERVVVVIGCGEEAVRFAKVIIAHRAWGYTLRGLVDADGCGRAEVAGFPVVAEAAALPAFLKEEVVDEVVLAVPLRRLAGLEDVLVQCQELGVRLRLALWPFPHTRPHLEIEALDGVPLVTLGPTPSAPLALFIKRVLDVSLSLLALCLTVPLLLMSALAVALSSPGPVLFRQWRCGLQGRRFLLLKFRTMVEGADSRQGEVAHLNVMDGPVFKAPRDPRVTAIGRVLRRFSLDELPQFLNVLRGDMSLVGPRPPLPEEVEKYEPWQRRRLAMKPGLTCLWQVSGRSRVDFATWMELDLVYIDTWSLWLDLKILLRTVPAVLSGRGAA